MCHVVPHKRLDNCKTIRQRVVIVTSLIRGSSYRALTGKILVLLLEVVQYLW